MWVVRSAKFVVLLAVLTLANSICGQAQKPSPTPPLDDIIRINTELVQTDVMVFDKKGAFVDGLKPEQFELTVEGKPHPISFFEQVRAGSAREIRLLAKEKTVADSSPANEVQGRTIVFFVDDLHLAPDSLERTRRALKQFLGSEMTDYDRVAIASTSGDLGFLQQFTDFKPMLQKATELLVHHPYNVKDLTDSRTPMTEYTALAIERNEDPGVLDFYIDRCLIEAFPLRYRRESCAVQVKDRARAMLVQSASVIFNTYASLESLMHSANLLPGRKLVFFFSDGFLLDTGPRNASPREKLKEITDAALRAGVVVYTVDARGLFSGQLDATNNVPFDKQNRLESTSLREGPAMQDALNALAGDTGGRALRNQNYFDRWINKVLDETSNYYLVAWRPDDHAEGPVSFKKIVVRVVDHPEYEVRMPQGFLNVPSQAEAKPSTEVQSPAQAHQDLQRALTTLTPRRDIQTALSAVFLDTPDHGPVLTTSVQVRNETLSYQTKDGKQIASVDVAGVVVNDRGKPAGSFQTRLEIKSMSNDAANENSLSIYNNRLPLPPGLYQVRVATRDIQSGRVGSAQQWVEIPNLSLGQLTLSSLLLGLQSVGPSKEQVQFSVDHRFDGKLPLGFMVFVYNATQGQGGRSIPNLSYQARLLRQGQAVFTTPLRKVLTDSQDHSRIVLTGVLPLKDVAPGRYLLELKVIDEMNQTSATQQTRVTVE
jgi:VWFA-related protein